MEKKHAFMLLSAGGALALLAWLIVYLFGDRG